MDIVKELYDMKETVANEIADENKKIRASGGKIDLKDVDLIDKLSHSMKSLATTCAMLEAEENGYSGDYMPSGPYYPGTSGRYSRESRENRNGYSGNRGGYSRNDGRYSRENRGGYGYSRAGDMAEQLRQMMDDAPD